jgi:uncharacterized protein (DUF1697 family)
MCYTQTFGAIGAGARMLADANAGALGVCPFGANYMSDINVLLLRGVNVGGANRLPMPEFRDYLSELGLAHVQTHIQSGNVVFSGKTAGLDAQISAGMKLRFGFAPRLFFYTRAEYEAILAANPYAAAGAADGKSVHIFFLAASFAETHSLTALAAKDESVTFTAMAVYLHAPSGVGRSVLAEKLGQTKAVDLTARNYSSAAAIAALARAIPA